jgi:hypothetical protein
MLPHLFSTETARTIQSSGPTTVPEPTPEAWAQIRHAYENTEQPLEHICAEHDVSVPTVRYRMKRWGWTRRKPFVPRQQPAAAALELAPSTPPRSQDACDPPPPEEGEESKQAQGEDIAIVPRLQNAAAQVLSAIETNVTRLASGRLNSHDVEKAGRTLGTLTRTLRELNALLVQNNAGLEPEDDPMIPKDPEEFRRQLARRIRGLVEAERAREAAEAGQEAQPETHEALTATVDGPGRT